MHRRVQQMEDAELLRATKSRFGRKRGQPEKLSLAAEGVAVLRDRRVLGLDVPDVRVTADEIHCVDHQLLTNWFRCICPMCRRSQHN